jgi:benzoyl-CoA reductase/2-hydroxyglutaryl-CoA dehydratase subunit BcrC/BadD/HgdB
VAQTIAEILARALTDSEAGDPDRVACLGVDVPRELIAAAALTPWRVVPGAPQSATGLPGLGRRSQGVLEEATTTGFDARAIVIAHDGAEDAQLFATLRELHRTRRGPAVPFAFIDLLHLDGASTRTYNLARLGQLRTWLETLTGQVVSTPDLAGAVKRANDQKRRLAELFGARTISPPRLSGNHALDLIRAVGRLPLDAGDALIAEVGRALQTATPLNGPRILITGSAHETSDIYRAIEASGAVIVSEDHAWGDPWVASTLDEVIEPLEAISARSQARQSPIPVQSSADRARTLAARAVALQVDAVLHLILPGDEASPWDIKATREAIRNASVPFLAVDVPGNVEPDAAWLERVKRFLATGQDAPSPARPTLAKTSAPPSPPAPREAKRSRKSLACAADFGAWQRDWFAGVRQSAAEGPFAVVNADAPQEILRALDIPYVVNQWWASIVAAKQKARDYGRLLRAADYPSHIESYSAQGLAAALDTDSDDAPWGGLPTPAILALVANSDPGAKLYEAWAGETGADLFVFERSIDGRIDLPIDWWDDLPERWSETLEPERLDLMTGQIEEQIVRLEALTGRTLDRARLVEVMNLVNEQEEYYRRTRDLIARSYPVPVSIVDTMPATMVPQWHRGTVWARDAAKLFFEEVSERVAAGEAACPGEKLRLMWVGRGLWSDTGFYQRWEESHGAVFVSSMYLSLAADGYLRAFEGEHDVVRALAARFLTMGDELRMPTWSGAWHVKEARLHGVHGAVAIDDADPLVLEALERAGVPVCRVAMNNMGAGNAAVDAVITTFLDGLTAALPSA